MNNDVKKLIESLLTDFKSIHNESKKKYPAVREAVEGGILKLRMVSGKDALKDLSNSQELFRPLILGCETKTAKIASTCLTSFQRLASQCAIGTNDLYKSETIQQPWRFLSSEFELVLTNWSQTRDLESSLDKTVFYHYFEVFGPKIVDKLEELSENGVEELRVLQTVIVLLTTSSVIQRDALAKKCKLVAFEIKAVLRRVLALQLATIVGVDSTGDPEQSKNVLQKCLEQTIVLCFHLYFRSDSTVSNTAAATIRQLLSVIIDRMIQEDKQLQENPRDATSSYNSKCPKTLHPRAQDAYLLFQDLCQLTNGESPYWLHGMTEMTRTFGLELLESVLKYYPHAFLAHPEFSFLLKERVCPLIIKLFSPNIKYRHGGMPQATIVEKPVFSVSMRLLRIVSILIKQFYTLLVTECEIFLSLLVKFLDSDKPFWQRALALEVLHTLCVQPQLLRFRTCSNMELGRLKLLKVLSEREK